ncbi:MAG: ATP-dependent DNA ligase, partial [Janthinobacterium lividum]
MRSFARLFNALDSTTATSRKLEALENYFRTANPADAAWAVYFLAGGKPRQAVPVKLMRAYAVERAGIDDWLFDESYHAVGDLAETIAHILPPPQRASDLGLAVWLEQRILPLRGATPETIREALFGYWDELDWDERFLLTKLISGGFRVGVSKLLVTRALGTVAGIDGKLVAQRLMGWIDGAADLASRPSAERYLQLIAAQEEGDHVPMGGHPYPFFLAHPLQADPQTLGALENWMVEWKYDGIRAQLVCRQDRNWLWSRGEDLISERFPELSALTLPDGTVIDGEILIWKNDAPAPFADLQKRIGRKTLSSKMQTELPAVMIAYDLLELDGFDIRSRPQSARRLLLEQLIAMVDEPALKLSPVINAANWRELALLREG